MSGQEWWRDESGAAAVEYAIMSSLVAAVVVASVTALGLSVGDLFQLASDTLP